MRRLEIATLWLAAVSLTLCGCRQTTGPTGGGPLTPLGPLSPAASLSPVGTSPSSGLGPFGGPTRVTPPATGSYVAPNNYMGGVVPIDQANLGATSDGGFSSSGFARQNENVIGSGVQVAGWNETNSVIPSGQGVNSSATRDPRSGGMQIIDLTGAPAPPGYRGTTASFPNAFQGAPNTPNPLPQGVIPPPLPRQPVPVQSFQRPALQNPAFQNQSPGRVQTIVTPSQGEIASSRAPAPMLEVPINASPVQPSFPRTANAPSTEPINSGSGNFDASQQNLPWRRPGARF